MAEKLNGQGRGADAGWLLLALVAPELVRPQPAEAAAQALAREAATLLGTAGETLASAEVHLVLGETSRAVALLRHHQLDDLADSVADSEELPQVLVQQGLGGHPCTASLSVLRARARQALDLDAVTAALDPAAPDPVRPRTAELLQIMEMAEILGLWSDAGRLAEVLGHPLRAGESWLRAGRGMEAAKQFHVIKADERALEALLSVTPDDPSYREACVIAIRLGAQLKQVDFSLYHLVRGMLETGPQTRAEASALMLLARLLEDEGHTAPAEDIRALASGRRRTKGEVPDDALVSELPPLPESPPDRTVEISTPSRPLRPGALSSAGGRGAVSQPLSQAQVVGDEAAGSLFESRGIVGKVVAKRYRIEEQLGRGGNGIVFKARDLVESRHVALKFLRGVGVEGKQRRRFEQEQRLCRSITHKNVVAVYDVAEAMGTLFISMELLHGLALRDVPRASLPVDRVLDVIAQAAEGLGAAHAKGVVHRDVTPDNLFLTQDGTVKVMDFGLANGGADDEVTVTGFIAGTPSYMPPEQVRSFSTVTPAADQYSLAIVAYRTLTGRTPFVHPELVPLLRMHAEDRPPPASSFMPSLPRTVDAVFDRALAKDPFLRFQSCRAFADALRVACLGNTQD
ncbi:MAG: serine/threonine protein kinase [Oligoflexia bacterium]|nr:serine/threonine protein kinase [Oligoflexia bacterium]